MRLRKNRSWRSLNEDSLPQNIYLAQQELISQKMRWRDLYDNAASVAANAQLAVAKAIDDLDDADYRWTLNQPGNRATQEELKSAKAKLKIANKRQTKKTESI